MQLLRYTPHLGFLGRGGRPQFPGRAGGLTSKLPGFPGQYFDEDLAAEILPALSGEEGFVTVGVGLRHYGARLMPLPVV